VFKLLPVLISNDDPNEIVNPELSVMLTGAFIWL